MLLRLCSGSGGEAGKAGIESSQKDANGVELQRHEPMRGDNHSSTYSLVTAGY